jgi:signal transduction histidine kinase
MARISEPESVAAPRRYLSALTEPPDPSPPGGRVADVALIVFAIAFGSICQGYLWFSHGEVFGWLSVTFGAVACLALWWRRAHPLAVLLLNFGVAWFAPMALGAGPVALCTAASRVRGRVHIAVVVVLSALASVVFPLVNPKAGEIVRVGFPAFLVTIIAFGWGVYLRTRRELIASLRERADRLEADQLRAAEQTREAERRRIAREMHDVLAHRLSLLSVHAGALEFHPDAPPAEIAEAAAVIRTSAASALDDLRQVITVLREDVDSSDGPPQLGFGQLSDLLEESRSAGMTLSQLVHLTDVAELPEAVGRTVYRVIQEGLTNARKHSPGAPVVVTVTANGQAVIAKVVSRRPADGAEPCGSAPAGAGAGLIGLAERVAIAGGQLEHGPNAMGDFVLCATLPRQP